MVQAVAVAFGSKQLQHTELPPLGHAQVDAEAEPCGRGEGELHPVALGRHVPHVSADRHEFQHVGHHQAQLLLKVEGWRQLGIEAFGWSGKASASVAGRIAHLVRPHAQLVVLAQSEDEGIILQAPDCEAQHQI